MGLGQTQYNPKDQEGKIHTLTRVDDDTHPGAAKSPGWKGVKEGAAHNGPDDPPWLVKVIKAKEHTVCQPAPPAENSFHFGQQNSTKQKLFSQDRIENGIYDIQSKEPPGANQAV